MSKIAVGTKVRVVNKNFGPSQFGQVGTVISNTYKSDVSKFCYKVEFGPWDWNTYREGDIEPVCEDIFIVVQQNRSTKKLTQAMSPFQHTTRELAETEAKRLAGLNPSVDFLVLQVVSSASATVTTELKKVA